MMNREELNSAKAIQQSLASEIFTTITELVMENNDSYQFDEPVYLKDLTANDWLNVTAITYEMGEEGHREWKVYTEIEYHYGDSEEVDEPFSLKDMSFEELATILDRMLEQNERV